MQSLSRAPQRLAFLACDSSIQLGKGGGPSAHIKSTIRGFEQHGIEVCAFMSSDYVGDRLPAASVPKAVVEKQGRARALLSELRRCTSQRHVSDRLLEEVIRFAPHVIYERSTVFSSAGSRLSQKLGCLHLLETSCCETEIFAEKYGLFSRSLTNLREARKLRGANAVITQSRASVPYARKKFNLPDSLPVIAKPLAYECFPASVNSGTDVPAGVADFVERFQICVIFVGTFGHYQGPGFLMDIIAGAHARLPGIGFLLCGGGGEQPACVETASKAGLDNVLFTGMLDQSQLASVLPLSHIAIVPDCEPNMSPIKTLHYGAYGVPVLVPDYKAFDGLIDDGGHGFRFKSRDLESALMQLKRCQSDTASLKKIGAKWQQRVAAEFNDAKVVEDVVEFIRLEGCSGKPTRDV